MSWLFSQALVEEYLQGNCLDGEQLVLSKSIPTAPADSCKGRMKATFDPSQFGATFGPSTVDHGAALLMWFRAASLAPILAQLGKKPVSMANQAVYGWKWPGSFARLSRDSSTWKIRQGSLIADSTECSVTWPRWGLMLDGECLDQTHLAPTTNGNEPGSWPTPCHGSSRWGGTFQEVGGSQNKLRNTAIGKLYVNPAFWESLMGWPIGWTGIAPLGMAAEMWRILSK